MPRLVLGIEYNGHGFCGWQWQPEKRSIQGELQAALAKVADHPVEAVCAGRTDAGVHAREQVVHCDVQAERKPDSWLLGGNTYLPQDIRILWVKPAVEDFHARYSATARLYRYVIYNRPVNSALFANRVTWWYRPLEAGIMHEAAQFLVGNHDFSSFRAQGCQSKSPFRMLHFIEVSREQENIIMHICANAFLHHMVRNIVGALLEIGMGKHPKQWAEELLITKQRASAGITAPAEGLYFEAVYYPERYGLYKHSAFNKLPEDVKRFD